jgi:hypothetical protein
MFNKSKNITNFCSCNLFILCENYLLTATALHDHCASNICASWQQCDGMLSGHVGSVQAGPLIGGLQCWLRPADSQRTDTSGDHQLT